MPALAIILLCIAAAVVYGIIHDQITARICVEYFTVAHPPVFNTDSPTLLGLGWGVIATWWVGAGLGIVLAAAARAGRRPRLTAADLLRPVCTLLAIAGVCAVLAGTIGYVMASTGHIRLVGWLADRIPEDRHARFLADGFAHTASYGVGAIGGVVLCVHTFRRRGCSAPTGCTEPPHPRPNRRT